MNIPEPTFDAFFKTATGGQTPYDYQRRLAGEGSAPSGAFPCTSQLINIPTGLGKTAAVVLAWLWNRAILGRDDWPRRLVYCLPMRTLVEQTRDEISKWLGNVLEQSRSGILPLSDSAQTNLRWLLDHSPIILMGGEENDDARREWDIHPERPAILIGTQDMLLSRALNRGYGMARARWPMHFGLLNNDALWVLDETQLMGPALWTSAQLDWLRQDRFLCLKNCPTWWMSATIGPSFLKTLDRTNAATLQTPPVIGLNDDELAAIPLLKATRPVAFWKQPPSAKASKIGKKNTPKSDNSRDIFLRSLANSIIQEHQNGTLSLVVCNNVSTAQKLSQLIEGFAPESLSPDSITLLTSRFRPADRREHLEKLLIFERTRKNSSASSSSGTPPTPAPLGLICVSTQVVEAGVDVSARRLWSELSPWPSTLQRLGRLNRDGRLNIEARAFIFDVPPETKKNSKTTASTAPYDPADIKTARNLITALASACANAAPDTPIRQILLQLQTDKATSSLIQQSLEPRPEPFPRALDLHGLFSTEPDAFGGFTDVSPWVRGSDPNADVTVFWRSWVPTKESPNAPHHDGPGFQRDEGCPVAIHRLRSFLEANRQAWKWDDKSNQWAPIPTYEICPGMTILLPTSAGGYDGRLGWTADKKHSPENPPPPGPFDKRDHEDSPTQARGHWVALDNHLEGVARSTKEITEALALPTPLVTALQHAASLHDIGKSIAPWQDALPSPKPDSSTSSFWAKAPWLLQLDLEATATPDLKGILSIISKEAPSSVAVRIEPKNDNTQRVFIQLNRLLSRATLDELAAIPSVKRPSRPHLQKFAPGLRHEAASALAAWHRYYHGKTAEFPALTIYLIAAHHGLVRTVLTSREKTGRPNVCGVPITDSPSSLPWNPDWHLDFQCAQDGTSGEFSEDGFSFVPRAPGWTGLVSDLLGGWEADASRAACGAVPEHEPHSLNPFNLAYLETLLRSADSRTSATEQGLTPAEANLHPLPMHP